MKAPFTPEQVKALNEYQQGGWMHPFTCGGKDCREDLVATEAGWVCSKCDYTQDWAHAMMLEPAPEWHRELHGHGKQEVHAEGPDCP